MYLVPSDTIEKNKNGIKHGFFSIKLKNLYRKYLLIETP